MLLNGGFSLRSNNIGDFAAQNPLPDKLVVGDFVFNPPNVEDVLHENLEELYLSRFVKITKHSVYHERTLKTLNSRLLQLSKLKKLMLDLTANYSPVLKFFHRSSFESRLTTLNLFHISDVSLITLKLVKGIVKFDMLEDVALTLASHKLLFMDPQLFFILINGPKRLKKLEIGAFFSSEMQSGVLHRVLADKRSIEEVFTSLSIRGVGRKVEKMSETTWRSVFGEVARGGIPKFLPRMMSWDHTLTVGPIETLEYCAQTSVLGAIVPYLTGILNRRRRPTRTMPMGVV